MSVLNDSSVTIYEALENIKKGKYVMPAFQREFVWNCSQIEKLWDSILLGYPISTFLFLHLDESNSSWDTYIYNFLESIRFRASGKPANGSYDFKSVDLTVTDTAVLDGQQRLTALYLSLYGQCFKLAQHEQVSPNAGLRTDIFVQLDKNKLNLDTDSEDDNKDIDQKNFDIRYITKVSTVTNTQFRLRDIVDEKFRNPETRQDSISEVVNTVPESSKEYAENVLNKLCKRIYDDKLIRYTEICNMMQDDALEMFVRFNSGGTALKKSDITLSILTSYWSSSRTAIERVLVGNYSGFSTDFIIRTSLMLFGNVLKSNITLEVVQQLKERWSDFSLALKKLDAILIDLKIDIKRFRSGWNILIPIIFAIYNNPAAYDKTANEDVYKESINAIRVYITRGVLFRLFQSGTTGKLNKLKTFIRDNNYNFTVDLLDSIPDLSVTDGRIEDVLESEKGSRIAGEALYYLGREWICPNALYDQDHLHPDTYFARNAPTSVSMADWRIWCSNHNKLPNLEYLTDSENRGRQEKPLKDYYYEKTDAQKQEFMDHAMIPEGVSLELKDFGEFFDKRRELLKKKLMDLLK